MLTFSNQAEIWCGESYAQNLFSSFGPVVFILTISGLFVLKKCVFQHKFGHISDTTAPIILKIELLRADFGHRVPHTKFQPLRLKDAEDIGWFIRVARLSRGLQRTVTNSASELQWYNFSTPKSNSCAWTWKRSIYYCSGEHNYTHFIDLLFISINDLIHYALKIIHV